MEAINMSRVSPETWQRLSTTPPPGGKLCARVALPSITEKVLAAIDSDGIRHLLVRLESDEPDYQDNRSRGIGVETRELDVQGHKRCRYLDLICQDSSGHSAFDLIGGDLSDEISTGQNNAPKAAARVLSSWRRFWGQVPLNILSYGEQLGLFAELWLLCYWMIPEFGSADSVRRWRGPLKSRHDFEWDAISVEVKAATSTRGRIHHINGLEQLQPPIGGRLFLFSMQLREEGGATNTLPLIVRACRSSLAQDPEALDDFEMRLSRSGHSTVHEQEYEKLKLRIINEFLFAVRENFPRLTPEIIMGGLPPGIEHVEYQIDLGGFDHLIVARKSTELKHALGHNDKL